MASPYEWLLCTPREDCIISGNSVFTQDYMYPMAVNGCLRPLPTVSVRDSGCGMNGVTLKLHNSA